MKIKGKKMINQKFAFPTKFRAGIAGHKWERSCYCQPFGRNLNNNPPRHASSLPTWIKKKKMRTGMWWSIFQTEKKKGGKSNFIFQKELELERVCNASLWKSYDSLNLKSIHLKQTLELGKKLVHRPISNDREIIRKSTEKPKVFSQRVWLFH